MNSETFDRLRLAREYQKKAIYALFPESAAGHLQVIENEMKAIMKDMMKDVMMDIIKQELNKQYNTESSAEFTREFTAQYEKSHNCNEEEPVDTDKAKPGNTSEKAGTGTKKTSRVKKVTID